MGFYPGVCCLAPPSSAPILVLSNMGTSGSRALADTKLDGMREGSQHSSWRTQVLSKLDLAWRLHLALSDPRYSFVFSQDSWPGG